MSPASNRFSRRDFLAGALAGAAAGAVARPGGEATSATIPASAPPSPPEPLKPPIRLGVVGGNFGAQLYWHEHPQCKVVAVSDLITQRRAYLQEVYHCDAAYPSLEEMLKQAQLDAIAIFTGATDLVNHCLMALDRRLHVCSASPAAMTLEDARRLRRAVHSSALTYFMAETSYFYQPVISARQWYQAGDFGRIFSCEAEYHHPGLEALFVDDAGKPTWRYGLPPMLYSTHCTGQFMAVTGERLVQVNCHGWGDDSPILKKNAFNNPFWGETALFLGEHGNALRAQVYWRGALGMTERANWLGETMSFWGPHPNGSGPIIRRTPKFPRKRPDGRPYPRYEKYDQTLWWETDMLPEPLRHISGHDGSHSFLTHEFIDALVTGRQPCMPVDLALDMALPGIMAHESAMQGGKTLKIPAAASL